MTDTTLPNHESSPEFIDYGELRHEVAPTALPADLFELIDVMVDRLPEPIEPDHPSWLPIGGTVIEPHYDTMINDSGRVKFGRDYTALDMFVGDYQIVFAKNNKNPHFSRVLINVPESHSQFDRCGSRVWITENENGMQKEYEAAVSDSDFLPHVRRQLTQEEAATFLELLSSDALRPEDIEQFTTLSTEELEAFYQDAQDLANRRAEFKKSMDAIRDAERAAVIDTSGIILRGTVIR